MKQKVFVIEDDPVIQAELITLLEGNSYEASGDRRKICVNDKNCKYEKQRLSQEWK